MKKTDAGIVGVAPLKKAMRMDRPISKARRPLAIALLLATIFEIHFLLFLFTIACLKRLYWIEEAAAKRTAAKRT
jgi:hypothetical protein